MKLLSGDRNLILQDFDFHILVVIVAIDNGSGILAGAI